MRTAQGDHPSWYQSDGPGGFASTPFEFVFFGMMAFWPTLILLILLIGLWLGLTMLYDRIDRAWRARANRGPTEGRSAEPR